jgi:hypothetical protein
MLSVNFLFFKKKSNVIPSTKAIVKISRDLEQNRNEAQGNTPNRSVELIMGKRHTVSLLASAQLGINCQSRHWLFSRNNRGYSSAESYIAK